METIFEPTILDPSSSEPSFLSFSSLADLQVYDFGASSPEPSVFVNWDTPKLEKQSSSDSGYRSDLSDSSVDERFPGLSACLPISHSARSSFSGSDDFPLLVTPTRQPSGGNPFGMDTSRSSSYSYADHYPPTPSLTNKSSCDSFASSSMGGSDSQPHHSYQWDERSFGSSMGGFPSMPEAGPSKQLPHRCVSNPTLSTSGQRAIVNRASMPSLKEEEASLHAWSFEHAQAYRSALEPTSEDPLIEDFDWVFQSKSGHVGPDETYVAAPAQPDWDTAATVQLEPAAEIYTSQSPEHFAWNTAHLPPPTEPQLLYPEAQPCSANPIEQRPLTAPGGAGSGSNASAGPSTLGVNMGMVGGTGLSSSEMLSVPQACMMSRRAQSSEGYSLQRQNASPRELFAFTPQRLPVYREDCIYTSEPIPARPQTLADRRQRLNVQIIPPSQLESSTYTLLTPPMPPAPLSAGVESATYTPVRATSMARHSTQPLPSRRHISMTSPIGPPPLPASTSTHLYRAQTIMQEREQQSTQRRVVSAVEPARPVTFNGNVVSRFGGWDGPTAVETAEIVSQPVLTTAPLPRYHPMPGPNSSRWESPGQLQPAQSYAPAHISATPASAPATPVTRRRVSAKPKARTPSGKRATMKPGGFSWGETTFINFTSDDAEKLLTGVAPSGSLTKRRREEEEEREDRESAKRSRSRE